MPNSTNPKNEKTRLIIFNPKDNEANFRVDFQHLIDENWVSSGIEKFKTLKQALKFAAKLARKNTEIL